MPFTDEATYQVFVNQYPNETREEPRLNIPEFTEKERQAAYELRQKEMPDRAATNPYDRIPPNVKNLLASPLYLHVFHETWKGKDADFSGITGEDALFDAYLRSLEKELPGIAETLKAIGNDLYEKETPVWNEEDAWEWTQKWMKANNIESAFHICTLTPIETLVSASLLMRPTDDETGYQFSHQKICEQVLKRRIESLWSAKILFLHNEEVGRTKRSVSADDRSVSADDCSVSADDRSVSADDRSVSADDRSVSADDRSVSADDRSVSADDRSVSANEQGEHAALSPPYQLFQTWLEKAERFDWLANAVASLFADWVHTDNAQFLSLLPKIQGDVQNSLQTVCRAVFLGMCEKKGLNENDAAFIKAGFVSGNQYFPFAVAMHQVYQIATTTGKTKGIFEIFNASLQFHEYLVDQDPDNTDLRRHLSVSYNNVGNIYSAMGEGNKALEFFEKSLKVMQELVAKEPQRADFLRELSVSYSNVGNIYKAMGEGNKALEFFEKSLKVMQELVAKEPQRADFLRDLSVSYNNVGNIYEAMGEGNKALEFFEKSLKVMQELVAKEPQRADFLRELSVSYSNVGNIYKAMGEGNKALEFFEKMVSVMQDLVAKEPQHSDFLRDLSVSYNNVGNIYKAMGEGNKALEFFEKDLKVMQDLVAKEPQRS